MNKTLNEMTIPELVASYEELSKAHEFAKDNEVAQAAIHESAMLIQAELTLRMSA